MSVENECERVTEYFKEEIKSIIKNHYGDTIKIDFDNLTICVDDRCAKFNSYENMLLALVIADFFMRKLPDISGNTSEKNLNTPEIH